MLVGIVLSYDFCYVECRVVNELGDLTRSIQHAAECPLETNTCMLSEMALSVWTYHIHEFRL